MWESRRIVIVNGWDTYFVFSIDSHIAGEESKEDKSIWPPTLGWYRSGSTYTQHYDYDVLLLC